MGGKALRRYGIETERKSSKEFFELAAKISAQLSFGLGITNTIPVEFKYSPTITATSVRCYRTKQDHGDLDVLLKIDHDFHNKNVNLKDYIKEHFNPKVIHNNGGVLSFDYDNFQIDFIPIRESNWEIAQVYFSYDPLGNAMGKTFHKLNLSYGWDGLKYKYRNFNGRNSHDIIISKDPRKIFEFGGYNYNRYLEGFNTIEEIFDFIVDGDFFDAEMFKMGNLNHLDRKRNRKRGSYHKFLEYIEKNASNKLFDFKKKSEYLPLINETFPETDLINKINKLDEKDKINKQLSEKLNGRLIMEWIPSLKDKALGDVIREFRNFHGNKYEETVLKQSSEELKNYFLNYYHNIYGK